MERPSRAEIAYEALRQAIIEQALVPGTKLREDEIGAHFGISRTLVRATLVRLSYEGLVDVQRKRTAIVAIPSADEAKAVFDVRQCLEADVSRQVAEGWTAAMGEALEAHIRKEEQAAAAGSTETASRLAGEFHEVLARQTGNPILARYVSELVSRCSLIMAVHGSPHRSDCSTSEHRRLVAALSAGDTASARAIMAEHLDAVRARALPGGQAQAEPNISHILMRYTRNGAAA